MPVFLQNMPLFSVLYLLFWVVEGRCNVLEVLLVSHCFCALAHSPQEILVSITGRGRQTLSDTSGLSGAGDGHSFG